MRIGDRAVLGGKAGVGDNLTIGADAVIGGASNIMANVPAGRVMMAMPSMAIETQVESYKALRRPAAPAARHCGTREGGSQAGRE